MRRRPHSMTWLGLWIVVLWWDGMTPTGRAFTLAAIFAAVVWAMGAKA